MSYPSKRFTRKLLALAPALCAAGIANAQQLEEVVVTAQKREQSVQDVPIAISAFGAETLQNKGITEVSQLANLSPNVILDAGTPFSAGNALAAYIRGIGQNDFAFNLDPGVGIYVDGVYLARTVGANVSLKDVERVEILKGPQGTLFGRNSIGGAVSIITKDPQIGEFAYEGEVTVGNYDRMDVSGFANIPLSDSVAATVAFASNSRDGFMSRVKYPGINEYVTDSFEDFLAAGYDGGMGDEGAQNNWVVRGKLKFEMNDDMRLVVSGDMNDVDDTQQANKLFQTLLPGSIAEIYNLCIGGIEIGATCTQRGAYDDNGNLVESTKRFATNGYVASSIQGVNVDADPTNDRLPYDDRFVHPDKDKTYATGNNYSKFEGYGLAAHYTWDISDNMEFKSITAYRDLLWNVGMDLDGSPLTILHTSIEIEQDQFSQEFQLNGVTMDDKLTYALGAYWFEEEGYNDDFVTFPAGLLQVYGPNDLKTEAWAVFANFNYQLTDRLDITVGGRYTEEDKEFIGAQQDLNAFNYKVTGLYPVSETTATLLGYPDPSQPLRYYPDENKSLEFDDFSPRVALNYQIDEDMSVYASYAKGFKTGSWTTRLSAPQTDGLDFGQEEARTYEIGLKSELLDRSLRVNAAAFYTEYEDIQLNFQEFVSPTIRNAGDAEYKGFDIDVQGYLTDALSFNMGIGYVDAEYTSVKEGATISEGNKLPKTPEWQFSFGPSYRMELASGGSLTVNVDYMYQDEMYNDTENSEGLKREAIDMVNASITFTSADEKYDIVLGGTNITDERYIVTGQFQPGGGQLYGSYNRPAEYYLSLRVRN